MSNQLDTPNKREALWIGIGFALFYFLFLGSHPLLLPDEGRYSEVAREMLVSRDFITPRLNGSLFFHKPILFYWLQTIPMSLFGINPWSIRLIPALLGVAGIVFVYWGTSLLLGRNIGRFAALILGTTPLYYGGAHYANLDLEVSVWLTASLLSLLIGIVHEKKSWLIAAYILGGLAFLTKGLIGLAFPAAIMGLWILATQQWSLIKKLQLPLGLFLFALITLPWLLLANHRNADFLHFFFYTQQFQRFTGTGFNNVNSWWFYIAVAAGGFLPWTYFLCTRLKTFYQSHQHHTIVLYLIIWAVVVLVFFSIPASKLVGYILPIFAPLAILTAIILVNTGFKEKVFNRLICILVIVYILMASTIQYMPLKNMHSTRSLVDALPKDRAPLSIVSYQFYSQDLPLYSQETVRIVYHWQNIHSDNWASELSYALAYDPEQKTRLIEENEFWPLWQSNTPLYVFVHRNELPVFTKQAGHFRQIAATEDTVVVTQK